MTTTLRLENNAASSTVDLIGDFGRIVGSRVFNKQDNQMTETYLITKEGTEAQIRAAVDSLEDMLLEIAEWKDDLLRYDSIWLRWITNGETEKRSLLHSFEFLPVDDRVIDASLTRGRGLYTLAVTRDLGFEGVANSDTSTSGTFDSTSKRWDISGTISGGHYPARIEQTRVRTYSGDGPYARYWIGIRPAREGTSGFRERLEFEDGVNILDATDVADTDASGGNSVEVDFGTEAMRHRISYQIVATPGATMSHMIGNYHVLIRARVTNADTSIAFRASVGYESPDTTTPETKLATHYITGNTNYRFYDMGRVMLPTRGSRQVQRDVLGTAGSLDNLRLNVEAQRFDGVNDARFDCAVLVPAWHSVHITDVSVASNQYLNLMTHEDGRLEAWNESNGDPGAVADTGIKPWGYPKEGGIMVVVAEGATVANDDHRLSFIYVTNVFKRWRTYHG